MSKPTRTKNRREDIRQEASSCGRWTVEGGRAGTEMLVPQRPARGGSMEAWGPKCRNVWAWRRGDSLRVSVEETKLPELPVCLYQPENTYLLCPQEQRLMLWRNPQTRHSGRGTSGGAKWAARPWKGIQGSLSSWREIPEPKARQGPGLEDSPLEEETVSDLWLLAFGRPSKQKLNA